MKNLGLLVIFWGCTALVPAQVTYEQLLKAKEDPGNWLTYSGSYDSHRHSRLEQISRENVEGLDLEWALQIHSFEKFETTPLVVDGIMYFTEPPNIVHALDTRTGRTFWSYHRDLPDDTHACCGNVNRGLAILGETLYMGTLDAYLIALDARTGSVLWEVEVAKYTDGYSITHAPLVVKDRLIVGVSGGEFGIRGFLDAYSAKDGKRIWRSYTVPGPGEPGNETWEGDSWKSGGAPTWLTGSFDPELNLIYWGTGNPSPDFNGEVRKGDNLYSDCVLALDADTGKMKWYFQFTPHDVWDWDAAQIPVLLDTEVNGTNRKLLLWPNRNAFYYVFDRETGELLTNRQFTRQDWADGLNSKGRPIFKPGMEPNDEERVIYPGIHGGTNWQSPSYSPVTDLFYLVVREIATYYTMGEAEYDPGVLFLGSRWQATADDPGKSWIQGWVPQSGEVKWRYPVHGDIWAGVLSTSGQLVFSGTNRGQFFALDAETGRELWRVNLGGRIIAASVTYLSDEKQLVTIAAGSGLFTFGLKD